MSEDRLELIYGRYPVLETLRSSTAVRNVWVLDAAADESVHTIVQTARANDVPVHFLSRDQLDRKVDGSTHQGVVAEVAPYQYYAVDDVLAIAAERGDPPFLLMLDHVKDVHNFGALLRTAEAAGIHGVIIPNRRSVSVTATVYKTSAGAINYVAVAQVANVVQTMRNLQEAGVWFAGLTPDADLRYDHADLSGALGIVVGEEGRGLSRLVRETCDFLLYLPMQGRVASLNASVAAGILIYEALRQRLPV